MSSAFGTRAGFTLVELVAVILVLGILSVVAYPILSSGSGYAEVTYQARLVSALRNMQMRAMQDNRANFCFQINFSPDGDPAFGAPTLDYTAGNQSNTCSTSIDYAIGDAQSVSYTNQTEMSEQGLTLTAQDFSLTFINTISTIGFNGLGQPVAVNNGSAACTRVDRPCVFTIAGATTRYVCINPQGYIFASDEAACTSGA